MDTLQNVFPHVPPEALERVLDICDQSVEAASDWLLENDWQDLMDDEAGEQDGEADAGSVEETTAPIGRHEQTQEDRTANGTGNGHIAAGGRIQTAGLDRANGHSVAVAAAAATRNYISRALSAGSAVSPGSNHSDQPGLTMAVSTGAAAVPATSGRLGEAHDTATTGGGDVVHRAHHHHHDRLGRHLHQHHRQPADGDREYESAGDPDLDSEDGEGEGEEDEDDDDEDDEDDEDDDDGDANSYYDSGDESYYHGSLPQLTKRVKVTRDPKVTDVGSSEYFWASFDDQVIPKTLIELLNTTLTKLAHSSVTLLNKSSKHTSEQDARKRLTSVLSHADEAMPQQHVSSVENHIRPGSLLSRILNGSPPDATSEEQPHAGQKRKRADESPSTPQGFFAHFFSINDLDMVWRSILHAHLFNGRFGDIVEFHTAASGTFSKRDFDELMHIYTNISSSSRSGALGASHLSGLRCCLLLPCDASEDEIFRVGKHLHTLLKVQGSLYYRTLDVTLEEDATGNRESNPADLLNEDGKLSEESFRRFARYRIKKEEVEANDKHEKEALGPDHFLAYQQQRKVDHCLQHLEKSAWVQRLSG